MEDPMKYIVLDPSGNFEDGKGHTGIAILQGDDWDTLRTVSIYAKNYATRHDYWRAVVDTVLDVCPVGGPVPLVIMESFTIRSNGYMIGKMPETIRLIGCLEYVLDRISVPYVFQMPSQAKSRFNDHSLTVHIPALKYNAATNRYYLNGKVCNDHVRDALKHLLYFKRYKEAAWKKATTKTP